MEPTPEVIDAIYREKVERARRMSPEEKFWAGAELFAEACERMKWGIRHQFPGADDGEVMRILRKRLAKLDRLEERRRAS